MWAHLAMWGVMAALACPVTPTLRAEPPKDPEADRFPIADWHVNADRTMWVLNWDGPGWHKGSGFQTSRVTFPEAGCWRVTVTAGDHELVFVTEVYAAPPLRRP